MHWGKVCWGMMLVAALALALAGCGSSEGAGRAATEAEILHAGIGAWTLPNADSRNTRQVGGPIDAASVSRLHVAWRVPIRDVVATPIVADGVVYTQDLSSNVQAIDLRSGRVRWQRTYEDQNVGPNGLTVADGRVYGTTRTAAFALDAKSGRTLWSRRLVRSDHEGIDMAPGYDRGTVYVSTAPTAPAVLYGPDGRGVLWALDAATGQPRWSWSEVPPDLWGRRDVNAGGGLWHAPAFDGQGHLFVDVANPAPFPGTATQPWGESRPGPNRWTNAIVKLDAVSGRMVWGRQVLPHDLYDWDLQSPVILAQAGSRRLALAAGKMGVVYAFDAGSGALAWKRSVGVHNGHDDDNLTALHGHDERLKSPAHVLPGELGGVETPMASDGSAVFVPVVNLPSTYTAEGGIAFPDPASHGSAELVALDVASGRVLWDRTLPHPDFGAATVANDLVFTTTFDGTVWALRTDTGAVAWKASLPAGTNTPVTVAGDTVLVGASVPKAAGDATELIAYRLGS